MEKDKVFQCGKCGATAEKKKKLCRPEKVRKDKVSEKDLKRKPCKK